MPPKNFETKDIQTFLNLLCKCGSITFLYEMFLVWRLPQAVKERCAQSEGRRHNISNGVKAIGAFLCRSAQHVEVFSLATES